jgi:hypothetical protein
MTPTIAAAWARHAEAYADWLLARVFVRRDVFGGYTDDGRQYTARGPVTRKVLVRHCRGERTVGAHTTSPDNRSLCVALDYDAHDEGDDPEANWRHAWAVAERARELGLTALVCDSNGAGGYHVRIFFKKPIPAAVAHWLGTRLVADWAESGLKKPPEVFPKQPGVSLDCPYGNWLRCPGKHPKRDHWTRIFDPETDRWLEGEAAVRRLLDTAGDDTSRFAAAYRAEQAAREQAAAAVGEEPAPKRRRRLDGRPDEATVRAAVAALPGDWADSYGGERGNTAWLGVGMALHDWDTGRGLPIWKEFSATCPSKYDPAVCDEKWTTFTQGGGLTVGTIFQEAERRGWGPPWAKNGRAHRNGRAAAGGGGATAAPEPAAVLDYDAMTDEELGLVKLSAVRDRPENWLWKYRLARGAMAVTAGQGGDGKSQLLLAVAATCTTEGAWFDGEGTAPLGHVVIVSAEDRPETTIKPRLKALGANLDRVTICRARVVRRREGKPPEVHPQSLQDLGYWAAIVARLEPVLFIVDPLPSYLGRGVDDHKNAEIRAVLERFVEEVIEPHDVCMIGNTHLNKAADARTPIHRIVGSIAYGNIPRNVHFVARDPDEPARRLFMQAKCNNAPDDLPALAYRVEVRTVTSDDGEPIEVAIPVFEPEPVAVDLAAIVGGRDKGRRGPAPAKTMAVAEWLFDHLAGKPGAMLLAAIIDAAGTAGLLGDRREKTGRWSCVARLYDARERLPALEPPRAGKHIVEYEATLDGKGRALKHWRLVDAAAPF